MGDGGEAIGAAIGDPPQERPLVEQLGVLTGGIGAQPGEECEGTATRTIIVAAPPANDDGTTTDTSAATSTSS
jgi:hypothetical protein